MKTSEALEGITDRGKFELLATSVLRRFNGDYATIMHHGINAQGETIKSPIDGFCLVPGSEPPRFLFVQHTTTDKKSLKTKWLNNKDGDLIKAGYQAKSLKKEFPNAKFKVILSTNQNIDICISYETYKKANDLDLECEILEQSRLVDLLDNTPEGHWLRKEYLEIEAELLSESLLKHLCNESLHRYEKTFLSDPNQWIQRDIYAHFKTSLLECRYRFQVMLGESGFGKSVGAYIELKNYIESGCLGLWAPAEFISGCTSIEGLIDKTLRNIYPNLLPDTGKDVEKFIAQGSKFIIVVDDINKCNNPKEFLDKLLGWSKPSSSNQDDVPFSPYLILCPLWPKIWDQSASKNQWIDIILFGPMGQEEGLNAIKSVASQSDINITDEECVTIAIKLGNDPFLIGLFNELLRDCDRQTKLIDLTGGVIKKFIIKCLEDVSSLGGSQYVLEDYLDALSLLSQRMVKEGRFFPSWNDVQLWFRNTETLNCIRYLLQSKRLCHLSALESPGGKSNLIFRHDRILEDLIVDSIILLFKDYSSNSTILTDPYYSELVGKAITVSRQEDFVLKELATYAPLSLFEAIKNFGLPTNEYHDKIIELTKGWMENKFVTKSFSDPVMNRVCRILLQIDSPLVLEITNGLPLSQLSTGSARAVLLARLRNGCAWSGALFCGFDYFEPGNTDGFRDRIIEHAVNKHGSRLIEDLRKMLTSTNFSDKNRKCILALTGFLGFSELEEDILSCWNLCADKNEVMAEAIWAAARCSKINVKTFLDPMIEHWASTSDEAHHRSEISEMLKFGFSHGINNEAIHYFMELYGHCEPLQWPLIIILELIDSPDAIEFIAHLATAKEETEFARRLPDWWDPSRSGGRRLSKASMDRLKSIWMSSNNDEPIKYQSFRIWVNSAGIEEIDDLRAIPPTSQLHDLAVHKRALLGDRSVIPEVLSMPLEKTFVLDAVGHIWDDKFMAMVEQYLKALDMDYDGILYYIPKLLTTIPIRDAEKMLTANWDQIKCIPELAQAAICVGTEQCFKLIDSSIKGCPRETPFFKHFGILFGFGNNGYLHLTQQHLDRLVPYLGRFDKDDLWILSEICQRNGFPEWSKRNIASMLDETWHRRYHPTDEDILQELDRIAKESPYNSITNFMRELDIWAEQFDKRHDSRALAIIDRWLESNCTIEGLLVAASFLAVKGSRRDLSILDKYIINGSEDEILQIKSDAKFIVYWKSLE